MKRFMWIAFLALSCSQYEPDSTIRENLRIKGEKKAADAAAADSAKAVAAAEAAEAARLAALELQYKAEAKDEVLSLRNRENESLLMNLDAVTGQDFEKLSQFPKLVFRSQIIFDQTTLAHVRARHDEVRARGVTEKEVQEPKDEQNPADAAEEKGLPPIVVPLSDSQNLPPKAQELALVDHGKGSCVIFSVAETVFTPEALGSDNVLVSPAGRALISKDHSQSSEACQDYFEGLLGALFKQDYFALHVGFIALPQDLED